MKHRITYQGFLQTVDRTFDSHADGVRWLRQIGRKDLIHRLQPV